MEEEQVRFFNTNEDTEQESTFKERACFTDFSLSFFFFKQEEADEDRVRGDTLAIVDAESEGCD